MRGVIVFFTLIAAFSETAVASDDAEWVKGREFSTALEGKVSVFREGAELREMLIRLMELRKTACLLDRRVDPSTNVGLQLSSVPLEDAFRAVADAAGCELDRLGSTLLVGRLDDLDQLLTATVVRREELKRQRSIPSSRRVDLLRNREVTWNELSRPVDVLEQIADTWEIEIRNRESVPHDLWAAGRMIGVDVVEALSIVLGQYDLTFELDETGRIATLIPTPSQITIEQAHRPIGMTADEGIALVRQFSPNLAIRQTRNSLSIVASIKQHEAISRLLGELPKKRPIVSGAPAPLSQRRFPVTIVRKPFSEIIQALKAQGVTVNCDLETLRQQGIDTETLISLDFENATADEFFTALCHPAGVTYEIEGSEVTMSAAPE